MKHNTLKDLMEIAGVPMDSPKVKKLLEGTGQCIVLAFRDGEDAYITRMDMSELPIDPYGRDGDSTPVGWRGAIREIKRQINISRQDFDMDTAASIAAAEQFIDTYRSQYGDNQVYVWADEQAMIILVPNN